jgi:ABC-type transporter Mla MlaB component
VEGVAKVGETLTAKVTPTGATVNYQWQASADDGTTWDDIADATSKTYILSENEVGKLIRVKVTGTGNYTGTKTSEPVGPVTAGYKFSYEVPADVVAGQEVVVPVTFETDGEPGDIGYDGVRFKFAAEGPEGATVTFKAVDSNNDEYTFTNEGYWGPPGGFDLPAAYSATTDWTLVFSKAGDYTITFSLIDADTEEVIAGITKTVEITVAEPEPVASTYKFSYEVPADVVAGQEVVVPVTFATDELGDIGYDGVRFKFAAEGPGDVTFKAVDSNEVEHTFTNEGYWGPPGGFELPAAYSAKTEWTLVFSKAGDYTITFSLIDADTEEVIAGITDSVTIEVEKPVEPSKPVLEVTGPDEEVSADAENFTVTFVATHDKELAYLEIDHNLGKHGELPAGVDILPEFKLYPDAANPWGSEQAAQEAEDYGVSATYDAANTTWTVTFGGEALAKIRSLTAQYTDNEFKIYSLVCDVDGVKSGSMYDGTYETTIVTLVDPLQEVIDGYSISVSYEAGTITAEFDKYLTELPAGLEGYKIDVLITLGAALPEGTEIEVRYNDGDPLPLQDNWRDNFNEANQNWLGEGILDIGGAKPFVGGEPGKWTITISGNEEDINTTVKIESAISNDKFETWTVIADAQVDVVLAAEKKEYHTYKFEIKDLADKYIVSEGLANPSDENFEGLTPVKLSIVVDENKDKAYEGKVRVAPVGANGLQLWAKDSQGKWYDINVTGWGPPEGFVINPELVTPVYVIVTEAFDETVTLSLVDVTGDYGAEDNIIISQEVAVKAVVDEQAQALAAVNDYLTPANYDYAGAPEALEGHLAVLGLDVGEDSDYAALDKTAIGGKNRKTAVFYDLNQNKPDEGYDLATLTTYFNDMVATRLVTEESMDLVNNAKDIEDLEGISFVTMLLDRFGAVSYQTHSGIPVEEKIATLQGLVERYNSLDEAGQAAVLQKLLDKRPEDGYARSQATTDALAEALTEVEAEPFASTYKFSYEVPDKVIAGESYTVPVTIEPETEGTVGYERVRFDVEVTTPDGATLQLLAEDTNGVVHDLAQIGYWGPENGFPIGPDYKATTEFTAIFSAPGEYTITFSLVDLDAGEALVTETVEITAEPTQEEIDAAKAAFLADLKDKVKDIDVAAVAIDGEDITVTFDRDANPAEVYQAANELVDALKGELEAATLTLNEDETDGRFDLTDEGVAAQIALYLLEGTSPQDFLKGKEAVEASYTAEATNEDGITFTLEGELVFKVAEPTQEEIDAAKAAFLADLKDKVKDIDVAAVAIDGEDITVTFDRDANPAEVYQAANELVDALKGELEAATLTLNEDETDGRFDLTDEGVAAQIALYLLEGTSPQDFLKGKEAVEASYTAEATNEDGITFTLEGELVFKVAEPTQEEIDAAKAAFLADLKDKVKDIDVAAVAIDGEDITVTFDRDANPAEVYQAANELVDALKGELEAATLTLNEDETDGRFDLTDEGVAAQIALYLLEGTSPQDFLKGKEAVEASYTAEATNEDGITFTLEGELVFKVAEPTQEEIDAAKAAFLADLKDKVKDIDVAAVAIDGEDITVTFDRDANPAEVYQAANELVDALKGELEAATLTLNEDETDGRFDLTDEGVAAQIALYLLEGTSPQDFLKGKEAVEASYTAEATNEDGITFTLEGELVFKVAEPTQEEIDAAKAAFLADLKDKVKDIDVAAVAIDGEDITVTFDRDANPAEVYQAANELVDALKGELEAATLTLNEDETDGRFDLTDEGVAAQIALYLLEGTSPQDFLKGKEAVEASYTAEATNEDGITFTLEGELVFKVAEPTQEEIDAAKAAFLADLKDKVKDIDVAAVAIDGEDITVTFDRDANPAEVYQAANELVDALKGELEAATLTLNEDETDGRFDLTDEGVAAQIALYLLEGTSPQDFLKGKEAVEASYTAEATNEDGITFTLEGELVFKVAEPTQEEIDAAKAAFLADLKDKVKDIDVAAVAIDGEDITVTFDRDANPAEVYQAANELVDALKGELEAATLTLNEDETDGRFDLTDEGVAAQIALYLLEGTSPQDFLKGKEAVEASYTAEATNEDGITFTLEGELVFKVAEPTQEEIDAAKAAFLAYLEDRVKDIDVADVVIDGEDITVTFDQRCKTDRRLQAANELVAALKGELDTQPRLYSITMKPMADLTWPTKV